MSTGLVALGSAAVFAVYATGFMKTKAAAQEFTDPLGPGRARVPPGDLTGAPPGPPGPAADAAPTADGRAAGPSVTLALPTTPASRAPRETAPAAASKATEGGTAPAALATSATARVEGAGRPSAAAATEAVSTPAPSLTPDPAMAASATPVAAAIAATPLPTAKYKDGTYTGWGSCRHGDIQAQVVVVDGRITNASVVQCLTRWSCSWISPLPPQVPQRQSAEVDYVSGATQSAIAFYNALVDAIAKAKP
jgi:uncharacterized protein with FMN-binding domain